MKRRLYLIGAVWVFSLLLGMPPRGWALLAPAETSSVGGYDRQAELKTVQKFLESKVLRERLKDMGLRDADIDARLSQLSDAQLHQVASRIQSVQPGGDAGLGILVSALVIGILVLLFIYLAKRV